jgi:hypothetical protein
MCENSLRSNSGSSRAGYKDMLSCVANAKSCLEIQSGCSSGSQCGSACGNYVQKCGGTSSSSGMQDCVQMCENSLRSNSGSSRAGYKDMLSCVANAKSCLEIQDACSPY